LRFILKWKKARLPNPSKKKKKKKKKKTRSARHNRMEYSPPTETRVRTEGTLYSKKRRQQFPRPVILTTLVERCSDKLLMNFIERSVSREAVEN
jgi:hypothetical protein